MKICDCKKHLEYSYTIDKVLPGGDITSVAVFECKVCGKEFLEGEIKNA